VQRSFVKSGSFHRDHAIEDATDLIHASPTPTAIFAANNILAEAAMMAVEHEGLRVPRDVSVVAFDDVQWMAIVEPPLTAVRQPVADMARSAAELALRRVREGRERGPSTMVFRTELIERASVAPARKVRAAKATPA
jgi:LacI family transcriptional regulator